VFKECLESRLIQLAFLISLGIAVSVIYLVEQYHYQQKHISTQKFSSNYVNQIRNNIAYTLSATYPIAALIRIQNGETTGFTELATEMLPHYPWASALQLQPDGILKYVVPLKGNSAAIGHNLLLSLDRTKEAFLARDTGKLTLAGPFELIQGGTGAAARLPIYLDSSEGRKFWGFSTVLIRFPDALDSINLQSLSESGIAYELSRIHPDTGLTQVISRSDEPLVSNPEVFNIKVANGIWFFRVSPIGGWINIVNLIFECLLGVFFTGLICFIAIQRMRLMKQSKQELDESKKNSRSTELQLKNVINGAQLGYWDWNYKTGEHFVNDEWLAMLGLEQKDTTNHMSDWESRIHPEDKKVLTKTIQSHIKSKTNYICEFRMLHADGTWVWIQGSGGIVEYDESTHEPLRLCGTHQNISPRKKVEEKTRLSARVFSETHDGITIVDVDMNIIDVNPAFVKITGYSLDEVFGKDPRILSSGKQSPEFYQDMWQEINEHGHWQGEIWNRKKNGDIYAELLTISELLDDTGNVINYIGVFSDITQSKRQQEKLNHMAHYDVLTGLPNRALFVDRFQQAIAHSKRTETQLAICFLDLDDFKLINDGYGHNIGDQVLIDVSQRIKDAIREEDTVSRQGGDEFTLLLGNIESMRKCEHLLERILDTLTEAFIIDDYSHRISASIGFTLYPFDDSNLDTLLRHADKAMYEAKVSGKNQYQLFSVQQDQQAFAKHHRLGQIKHALENNELSLYYQPKVNMVTGEVFGAEALIRWLHPDEGLIPPLEFLPIIDGTTLELHVGQWVIKEALTQLDTWRQQGIQLEVSINISSRHLLSANFFSYLEEALAKYPALDSAYFQLEILETSAFGDLDAIGNIIKICQENLGINFDLDDFGTGYSSLAHLRNLPINTIKIDQAFVRDMMDDPDDASIIDGIIKLAEAFHRKVIAEGVETTLHGEMLIIMGCEQAQGYGIAKPMPAEDMGNWLSHYSPNQNWLSRGRQERNPKEEQLALFRLIYEHWHHKFISNIQSPPEEVTSWPIMEAKQCPCNTWINRARHEKLFGKSYLDKLSKAIGRSLYIAQSTLLKYQEGDLDAARGDLAAIQASLQELHYALELFE